MAIVGISPTYTEEAPEDINIYDVLYIVVTGVKTEDAQQNIELPASGKGLTIENGEDLTFTAGNSIILQPGFSANFGSKVRAQINPAYTEEMDISVPVWYNAFSPNGDGINDELCYTVENANSWEFEVFDPYSGLPVFQSAGVITGNHVCVWGGAGGICGEGYTCIVRFKNNYGRVAEKGYTVFIVCD